MLSPLRRAWLAGALTPWILIAAGLAAGAAAMPNLAGIGTLARIADSLAPQLIAAALIGTALLAALRASRATLVLAIAACVMATGLTAARHLSVAAPVLSDRPTDLTILWFNLLSGNETSPDRLAGALAASPADIVVLGEARPLFPILPRLAADFPHRAGCTTTPDCEVLVLSRIPLDGLAVTATGRVGEQRLARFSLALPGRAPLTVVGLHLIKPWFLGFAEREDRDAITALEGLAGPRVVVGDLNAAPWSRRLQALARGCGLAAPLRPRPTWPAAAGPFGVPIDHVLVGGGARLAGIETWGRGLGSNHLGLLARISLPPPGPLAPAPQSCHPPEHAMTAAAAGTGRRDALERLAKPPSQADSSEEAPPMDAVPVDDIAALMQALAAAEAGARIEIAGGEHPAPTFEGLVFDGDVVVASADPERPAVFVGATRILASRNLVLAGVALRADGAQTAPLLTVGGSREIDLRGLTLRGHVPGPEGADPFAAGTGRMQPIAGFPFGEGVRIRGSTGITLDDAEITATRRAIDVFDSRAVSLERLEVHGVREGLNFHDVTGLALRDSHFHDFRPWIAPTAPGFDGRRHDHPDMVQYWGVRSDRGVHDITIAGNVFEQREGSTQTVFGHLGRAPAHVTATDFAVLDNVIVNAHPNAIRLGDVAGGTIAGNVLLPSGTHVRNGWAPRIDLTGRARDIAVTGNVQVRPGGQTVLTSPDADLAEAGIRRADNLQLSLRPGGNGLYWQDWADENLAPLIAQRRR